MMLKKNLKMTETITSKMQDEDPEIINQVQIEYAQVDFKNK